MTEHIPAVAMTIYIHVPIDPPRTVLPSEHPEVEGEVVFDRALWIGISEVSLIRQDREAGFLFLAGDEIPAWVPEPPKGWREKFAAFDAAMREVK